MFYLLSIWIKQHIEAQRNSSISIFNFIAHWRLEWQQQPHPGRREKIFSISSWYKINIFILFLSRGNFNPISTIFVVISRVFCLPLPAFGIFRAAVCRSDINGIYFWVQCYFKYFSHSHFLRTHSLFFFFIYVKERDMYRGKWKTFAWYDERILLMQKFKVFFFLSFFFLLIL